MEICLVSLLPPSVPKSPIACDLFQPRETAILQSIQLLRRKVRRLWDVRQIFWTRCSPFSRKSQEYCSQIIRDEPETNYVDNGVFDRPGNNTRRSVASGLLPLVLALVPRQICSFTTCPLTYKIWTFTVLSYTTTSHVISSAGLN